MKTIDEILELVIHSGYEFAKDRYDDWEGFATEFLETNKDELWDEMKRPAFDLLSESLYHEAGMAAMNWYAEDYGLADEDDFNTFEMDGNDPGAYVIEGVDRFLKELYPEEFQN
ncbi:MAG: hypothetical protein MJZ32_07095 [Bacteroidaceae bacterium]|nr:hypothetical protein [Bacteroidaceae bacterium]